MKETEIDFFETIWFKLIVAFFVLLFLALIFRGMFFNFIDSYEKGYKFDKRTGELSLIDRTGYIMSPPFVVSVQSVDIRPVQVCINANARVLNCKLVQFNTKGIELFLSWHGRKNYSIDDGDGSGSFVDILRSYAYSGTGQTYPFLTILKELKPEPDPTVDTFKITPLDTVKAPIDTIR